ncbi:MAG: MmcQ/YjbR family DNA-binding protein [Planctomycetes bacterium]|nr:MmcQ/YjbR family DNA-binding protein [Planctomycetota bacterium]
MPMSRDLSALARRLRAFVQTFPGAWEDHPWGETVAKVGPKVFVFGLGLGLDKHSDEPPGIAVKLKASHGSVAKRSFASPTGYGLGKSGWLTLRLDLADAPSSAELEAWIEESYRLVAPKRLLAELDASASSASPASRSPSRVVRPRRASASQPKAAKRGRRRGLGAE